MPNYPFTLTSWSDNSGTGLRPWSNPGNAQVLDTVVASVSFVTISFESTHYLRGVAPNSIPSWGGGEVLTSIDLTITRNSIGGNNVSDVFLYLVVGGTILTGVNKAAATIWPVPLTAANYSFSTADLAALGIGTAQITSTFGVALSAGSPNTSLIAGVDQIAGAFNTSSGPPPTVMPAGELVTLPPYAFKRIM